MTTVITKQLLASVLHGAKDANLSKYAPHLEAAMLRFRINTNLRKAHFLSQIAHESGEFNFVVENLNYSQEALMRTWPKRFPNINTAAPYHRNPERIANLVYANRLGNGPESSGDGWRYRGRGLIQITGKFNYSTCGAALGIDLATNPQLLEEPKYAVESAAWFWGTNGLNELADKDDVVAVTRRINGGTNGLDDRQKKYAAFKTALGLGAPGRTMV